MPGANKQVDKVCRGSGQQVASPDKAKLQMSTCYLFHFVVSCISLNCSQKLPRTSTLRYKNPCKDFNLISKSSNNFSAPSGETIASETTTSGSWIESSMFVQTSQEWLSSRLQTKVFGSVLILSAFLRWQTFMPPSAAQAVCPNHLRHLELHGWRDPLWPQTARNFEPQKGSLLPSQPVPSHLRSCRWSPGPTTGQGAPAKASAPQLWFLPLGQTSPLAPAHL